MPALATSTPVEEQQVAAGQETADDDANQGETTSLIAAWWCLDVASAMGPRSLWCYTLLLAEELGESRHVHVAASLVRRWSWSLLLEDARAVWRSVTEEASGGEGVEVQHNALAWARRRRSTLRDVPSGTAKKIVTSLLRVGQVFDVKSWVPGDDTVFKPIRDHFAEFVGLAPWPADSAPLAVISPPEAQRRLASALWKDARAQLMNMELPLREGTVEATAVALAAQSLLAVAALSLSVDPAEAHAAWRALLRLCESHGAVVRASLRDSSPVLLWSAWVSDGPSTASSAEVIAELLPSLWEDLVDPASVAVMASVAAAKTSPGHLGDALVRLVQHCVARVVDAADATGMRAQLASMRSRLQRWLGSVGAAATADGDRRVFACVEALLREMH